MTINDLITELQKYDGTTKVNVYGFVDEEGGYVYGYYGGECGAIRHKGNTLSLYSNDYEGYYKEMVEAAKRQIATFDTSHIDPFDATEDEIKEFIRDWHYIVEPEDYDGIITFWKELKAFRNGNGKSEDEMCKLIERELSHYDVEEVIDKWQEPAKSLARRKAKAKKSCDDYGWSDPNIEYAAIHYALTRKEIEEIAAYLQEEKPKGE